MGLSCIYKNESCFGCYTRCFRVRRFFRKKNKTSPDSIMSKSPPSIALITDGCHRTEADEQSIQDTLSLFHFGQKTSSGRRFSHPNQVKYVDEYERRKGMSQPGSPASSLHPELEEFDYDEVHVNKFLKDSKPLSDNELEKISPVLDDNIILSPSRAIPKH